MENLYLKGMESLHFNISHCNKSVSCGISEYPIGVDVQDYEETVNENIMKLVFSDAEIKDIQKSAIPEKCFTRYWTLKESYYKCIGTGLLDDMKEKNFAIGAGDQFCVEGFCFYTKQCSPISYLCVKKKQILNRLN